MEGSSSEQFQRIARLTQMNVRESRDDPMAADVGAESLILNLGCGTRTSPRCVNIDWSSYTLLRGGAAKWLAPLLLTGERMEKFGSVNADVHRHNLKRGIPYGDESVDAVYHSHFLEHIPRPSVTSFLAEVRRVLRPGGVHRIVVPDLERLCREYLADVDECSPNDRSLHDEFVTRMFEQCVRREAAATSQQRPLRRLLENLILGDARRRGEAHQWMYDRVNLGVVLEAAGFTDIQVVDHRRSDIPGWSDITLDTLPDGSEYLPGSLYMEARRS